MRHAVVVEFPQQEQPILVRDADEADAEYAARNELFVVLLGHAWNGDCTGDSAGQVCLVRLPKWATPCARDRSAYALTVTKVAGDMA